VFDDAHRCLHERAITFIEYHEHVERLIKNALRFGVVVESENRWTSVAL